MLLKALDRMSPSRQYAEKGPGTAFEIEKLGTKWGHPKGLNHFRANDILFGSW